MPRYQASNREYSKILMTMCKKALCSLFPLGLPPDLLLSPEGVSQIFAKGVDSQRGKG
jgi:hypothetical protein